MALSLLRGGDWLRTCVVAATFAGALSACKGRAPLDSSLALGGSAAGRAAPASSVPSSAALASGVPSALDPAPTSSGTAQPPSGAASTAALSLPSAARPHTFVAAPPVTFVPKVVDVRKSTCSVSIRSVEISSGIGASALPHLNDLLRVPPEWKACVAGEDTSIDSNVSLNRDGILSLKISGGRLYRNPPESAMGGAGDSYGVFLNVAVPSGYELNMSDVLTDVAPERFAKVVQPELLKALSQPGFSAPSERQTDLEICSPFFSPDSVGFRVEKTGLLISAALPHAYQALPPLQISFAALQAEHLLRVDGPLGPLLKAKPSGTADAGAKE